MLILSIESLYEVRRGCYRELAHAAIAQKSDSIIVTSGSYYDVKNDLISAIKNPSVLNSMQVVLIFCICSYKILGQL
jgi:hypothetical protein